jgi:hypothetical protein
MRVKSMHSSEDSASLWVLSAVNQNSMHKQCSLSLCHWCKGLVLVLYVGPTCHGDYARARAQAHSRERKRTCCNNGHRLRSIVLVNRGLVTGGLADKGVVSISGKTITTPPSASLVAQLSFLANEDSRIAQALSSLDACTQSRSRSSLHQEADRLELVHLPDMLQTLSPLVLPLLPQLYQYVSPGEQVQLPPDRVQRICSVNAHGLSGNDDNILEGTSTIYPLVSLMNHSSSPNCQMLPASKYFVHDDALGGAPVMVVAVQPIRAGDELTICYHEDERVLRDKWGIHDIKPDPQIKRANSLY